ncbi:MAG: hypothetical protein ACREPK_12885 [Rhodanobacteraceae bacterium]
MQHLALVMASWPPWSASLPMARIDRKDPASSASSRTRPHRDAD